MFSIYGAELSTLLMVQLGIIIYNSYKYNWTPTVATVGKQWEETRWLQRSYPEIMYTRSMFTLFYVLRTRFPFTSTHFASILYLYALQAKLIPLWISIIRLPTKKSEESSNFLLDFASTVILGTHGHIFMCSKTALVFRNGASSSTRWGVGLSMNTRSGAVICCWPSPVYSPQTLQKRAPDLHRLWVCIGQLPSKETAVDTEPLWYIRQLPSNETAVDTEPLWICIRWLPSQ
jgi:hypothetical protein